MGKWIAEFDLEDGDIMPEHMDLEYKNAKIDFHCRPLEQEPTTKNDLVVECINRTELLKAMNTWDKFGNDPNLGLIRLITPALQDRYVPYVRYEDMVNCVKGMPSVTPQSRWIPVSEKLPDPFTFVNATCRSLVDDRENWVVETIYLPIPKEHNPRHYSDWGNIPMLNLGEAEVIAWMERIIPEPYVVEEQGENT